MKPIKPFHFALTLSIFFSSALFQPAFAIPTTTAGQDTLRIHTSLPKRPSDSLFSYTAEWRVDDGELYRSTGISFLNAAKIDSSTPSPLITKKLLTAMKMGWCTRTPTARSRHSPAARSAGTGFSQ